MTKEDLDEIEARLNVARTMNAIEEDDEDDCENNVSRYYEHDVSMLVAEAKRLQSERDATVADLRNAIATVCDDECKFCKHDNSPECVTCNIDVLNRWEWRGVRETVNG